MCSYGSLILESSDLYSAPHGGFDDVPPPHVNLCACLLHWLPQVIASRSVPAPRTKSCSSVWCTRRWRSGDEAPQWLQVWAMFCMGDLATFLSHEVKYFCVIVPDAVSLPSVTFHLPPVRMGVSVIVCSRHLRQRNDDPHQKPGLCGRHGHRCHAHWCRHLPARCVCVCKPTLFLFASGATMHCFANE